MKRYDGIVKRELLKHRKRSLLTLLVITLGVSILIFLSEIGILSNRYNLKYNSYSNGDRHFVVRNTTKDNLEKLESNALIESLGVTYKETIMIEKNFVGEDKSEEREEELFYANEAYLNNILLKEFYSLEGRFPKNQNEAIILQKDRLKEGIGDTVRVKGKDRIIVGVIEDRVKNDGNRDRLLLGLDKEYSNRFMIHAKLKNDKNIVDSIEQIGKDIGVEEMMCWVGEEVEQLAQKETLDLNIDRINLNNQAVEINGEMHRPSRINAILIGMIVVALIFLTYISINATVKEKKKVYSILKCIGGSNGQIRSLILKESVILALCSIIPGMILGEIVFMLIRPKMLFILGNANLNMSYGFSIKSFLMASIIVTVVCIIASLKPMLWITRLSPIDGVKDENILIRKKRIRSSFIRKILGYEAELAYKNLKSSKGSFIGLTLIMSLALIIFNVFTSYYTYQIKALKASFGVIERDLQVDGLSEELVKRLELCKEYGDYSKFMSTSNIIKFKGINEEVLKDSENFLYLDKEKNEIVSNDYALITVINDKGFKDLLPYIEGANITLEKFKENGAILYSNNERGALHPPKSKNNIEIELTELDTLETKFLAEGNEVKNKEIFKPKKVEKLNLNLLGTTYFENIVGPRITYDWNFIGIMISEETAKQIEYKDGHFGGVANFEFKNNEMREKYLPLVEGRLKADIKENLYMHTVYNSYESRLEQEAFINTFATIMYTTLGYILGMMLLCLINTRDIILNARKKEFGVVFAVGMDKKMLRKCLAYEGIIQSAIALIIGNILSLEILNLIKMSEMKFIYPTWILFVGSSIIILVSALNTLNTIRRLSSDKPVEMIKSIE